MSSRAACRLAQLDATDVYDYAAGKMDWLAHGLPNEGDADLVGRHVQDVPTCAADERVDAVAARVGDGFCVVIGPGRVVLGTLTEHQLAEDRDANVARVP